MHLEGGWMNKICPNWYVQPMKMDNRPWKRHPHTEILAKRFIFCISWKISPLATRLFGTITYHRDFNMKRGGFKMTVWCTTHLLFYHMSSFCFMRYDSMRSAFIYQLVSNHRVFLLKWIQLIACEMYSVLYGIAHVTIWHQLSMVNVLTCKYRVFLSTCALRH